ncbi:hypothetical protein N656DRAFT_781872 [Canariomyces notabilis]|uniref:Uncharacterized protein n=1 Tax=Canariomyces notabilis TaxID=2074819 RepID=A0AAN6QHK5_9PEZI|nr:hypothetical protein N656DRAFT_781872 [Canariomyces arenarius]
MEPGSLALTAFFRHPRLASGVRLGPVTARTGSPIRWNAQRTFPEIPFPSTGRSAKYVSSFSADSHGSLSVGIWDGF